MNPFHHAVSSVRRYGGVPEDYLPLHQWFDESKMLIADFRHRALRHHAEGIFLAERLFGPTLENGTGRKVPTRFVGEQHVLEDLGWIPTVQDWLRHLQPAPWMLRCGTKTPEEAPLDAERCDCEDPGDYRSGVPGILACVENGRLVPGATVERCDLCRRFLSDEAALAKLVELGIA